MLIIITIMIIVILLFVISRPKETSGITLYFANIGTGKTTYLAKIAQKELKKMKKGKSKYKHIVSNALISGVTYVPDIRKLLKVGAMQHCLILVDEGSIVYNNRKMNLTDMEIQYFKLIRHYTSSLVVLSQSHDDVDVTLRRLYTSINILKWLPFITLIMPITKSVGIDELTKQITDQYSFKSIFSWSFFFRPMYFKYFNSWWIPSDVDILELSQFEKIKEYEKLKVKGIKTDDEIIQIVKDGQEGRKKFFASITEISKKIAMDNRYGNQDDYEEIDKLSPAEILDRFYES